MTKEETIASLNKASYSQKEVLHLISGVKSRMSVSRVKKGDVIRYTGDNVKPRPMVIFKIHDNRCYCLPFTTCDNDMVLCPSMPSRFSSLDEGKDQFFSRCVICCTMEHATNNFLYPYDNPRVLSFAIKEMKMLTHKILK